MEAEIQKCLAEKRYRKAFEGLIDAYRNKVFRLAFSMLRNESLAEDMAQEVFVRVWKALPKYRGESTLSTWIYSITRNTCFSQIRSQIRQKNLTNEIQLQSLDVLEIESPIAGKMDVAALLDKLPEKYRQLVILFYLEEKSYPEVAKLLDLPEGTVKTQLHRARKMLAEVIEGKK